MKNRPRDYTKYENIYTFCTFDIPNTLVHQRRIWNSDLVLEDYGTSLLVIKDRHHPMDDPEYLEKEDYPEFKL